MQEEFRKQVSEDYKDERPFFMSWDKKSEKWILNVQDPQTKEVVEQKVFMNGGWRKLSDSKKLKGR